MEENPKSLNPFLDELEPSSNLLFFRLSRGCELTFI